MTSPTGTLRKSWPGAFRNAVGWILCLILAFVFTLFGGMKPIGRLNMVQEFRQVGLGQWFRYFTGILEVGGGLGVLIPRVSRWAALLLAVVMCGAIVAHLTVLHSSPALPAGMLLIALIAAWVRD